MMLHRQHFKLTSEAYWGLRLSFRDTQLNATAT